MLTQDELNSVADKAFRMANVDEAELIASGGEKGSTRFSGNAITQNMDESTAELRLRLVRKGVQAVASGNRTDEAGIKSLCDRARRALDSAEPDPTLLPMRRDKVSLSDSRGWDAAVAEASPAWRASAVAAQVGKAKEKGLEAAGLLSTGQGFCYYANSHGVRCHHRSTLASSTMSAFADSGESEGGGDAMSRTLAGLDTGGVAAQAVDRALKGRKPGEIPPGKYDVVLTEEAVSDLMLFLVWLGFGTQRHVEGRAGLAGKFGQKVFSEHLTVTSDPGHPLQLGRPFDFEGFETQAITLVARGVPTHLPHDRRTAAKLNATNTGHGMAQPDTMGPMAGSIVLGGGTSSVEEMIAGTDRGLLVGQFHYTNTVEAMSLTVTGMTRGGLWLIEKGKVTRPVRNMRFTESLTRAFGGVDAVGSRPRLKSGGLFGGGMVLAPLRTKEFTFSSATGF